MACPRCHVPTPPGGRFCAQCSTPLAVDAATPRTSRRQMTVLICDLVGSTDIAQRVDPDDLLDALQRCHYTVRLVAARFGGFVARVVGDGVDVYFGYPVADEDDAARATYTALALMADVPRIEVSAPSSTSTNWATTRSRDSTTLSRSARCAALGRSTAVRPGAVATPVCR